MLQRDVDLGTPPMTPERMDHSHGSSLEEEPEELLFVTPPEGDRQSGMARDELTKAEGNMDGNFPEQLNELVASRSQLTPAETPAGIKPQTPAGPDAPNKGKSPPAGDEEWQPSESEPVAASTPPSSPAAKGWDDPAIPPFQ